MSSAAAAPAPHSPAGSATPVGHGWLALAFQEALTAVTRLRAGRQPVTDGGAFRSQMLQLLARADHEARSAGFPPDDARLAVFAVVALLDESALNSAQPALADWSRRPLQDELFGGHMAGEWFFQHVEQLLGRPDSAQLADLLEVYQLSLLLGFRGRYGAGDPNALHAVASRIGERVARLRGTLGPAGVAPGDLVPGWRPPDDAVVGRDPWLRRLTVALAASVVLALLLWGAGALTLRGAAAEIRAHAAAGEPGGAAG